MIDYPSVRRACFCPRCHGDKEMGLVLCWPCFNDEREQNDGGFSEALRDHLDMLEQTAPVEIRMTH